jgi:hypothetical protein
MPSASAGLKMIHLWVWYRNLKEILEKYFGVVAMGLLRH